MLVIVSLLLYTASQFNRNPIEEIIVDHVDSFEVLDEKIIRPKNLKKLNVTAFAGEAIDENNYPYPGHAGSSNEGIKNRIINEGKNIENFFNKRSDFTQDELSYHPTAYQQDKTTYEKLSNLTAMKVRVTLNPYVGDIRVTNMYMPAGELITFEYLSEEAKGSVTVTVNPQKYNEDSAYSKRYPYQQATTTLKNKISTWGYPFGGPISLSYYGSSALELTVSGCLRAPLFQYGVTNEAEFDREIKASIVPKSAMDIGCSVSLFSTGDAKSSVSQINDVAQFYRSAKTRSQWAVKDRFNPRYDRPTLPNRFWFDDHVSCGSACTYPYSNINQYPDVVTPNMVNYGNLITGRVADAFILLHEMNHLHQTNFGYSGTTEVSNNMLTMMTYGYQSTIPFEKKIINNKMYGANFQEAYTIYQFMFKLLDGYFISWDSSQWSIMYHSFGGKMFTEYAKICSEDIKYPAGKFGEVGRHILAATEAFKTGMLEFCELSTNLRNSWDGKRDAFLEEYNRSPYKDIKFHPVCMFYAVGFERDGERFATNLPWGVDPYSTNYFNFNNLIKHFNAGGDRFGKFQFAGLNGTEGRWKETSKGVYEYKAGSNISEVDEYTVDYLDTTTNRITRTYGQFKIARSWYRNFTGYTYFLKDIECFNLITINWHQN